jgi:hypothetical protein
MEFHGIQIETFRKTLGKILHGIPEEIPVLYIEMTLVKVIIVLYRSGVYEYLLEHVCPCPCP